MRYFESEVAAKGRQALGTERFDQAFTAGLPLTQREAVAEARARRGRAGAAPLMSAAEPSDVVDVALGQPGGAGRPGDQALDIRGTAERRDVAVATSVIVACAARPR
jgi:hypothetical protein